MSHTLTKFTGVYTDWVNDKDASGAASGPPWDEIIRAFVHYTGNFRKFPKPSLEDTQWELAHYEGGQIETDEGSDGSDIRMTHIYLYDHNKDLMAEYVFGESGRMRSRIVKESKLPSYRQKKPVAASPELGKALKSLLK